jgi:RND family efflux transporter MFP subunit
MAAAKRGLAPCGLLLCLALGCARPGAPPAEKVPPATVKWEGALTSALEEWTELVGTTTPLPGRAARVTAPIEGRVLSLFGDSAGSPITEGQQVEKGTVLVRLDTTLVEASLARAVAAMEVLREEEQQAQLTVDQARRDVERLRKLKEEEDARGGGRMQLVSPVDREKADYALKDAESKLKGAKGRLVQGAKDEEALRTQLKLHALAAPISGRLGRLQIMPGQTLSVGAAVADVIDLDEQIDVLCFVPAGMVRRLRTGQLAFAGPVEKDASAAADPEADGQVEYIADQAEPETGNFAVKVRFNNKEAHLRANRVLRIRVLTQPGKECLSLPEAAVSEDQEVPTVVIVEDIKVEKNDEGKEETVGVARRLQARLGVRDRTNHQVEIVGLEDPDKEAKVKWQGEVKDQQFVVEGGLGLQTGDKVKLQAPDD